LALAALGGGLAAVAGFGSYLFGQRVEHDKRAHDAYSGHIKPKRSLIFSAAEKVFPKIEFGDSGAILIFAGPEGSPLFKFAEDTELTIVNEDNQVKVSTVVRDRTGRIVAELRKNEWKVNPNNSWDRNYTSNTLEVKDPSGEIVLQVKALRDRIQLQAKMFDSSGRGFAFGKLHGPDGWGGGIEFTGAAHPELQMKFEPMFAYPSDSHLGELAHSPPRS